VGLDGLAELAVEVLTLDRQALAPSLSATSPGPRLPRYEADPLGRLDAARDVLDGRSFDLSTCCCPLRSTAVLSLVDFDGTPVGLAGGRLADWARARFVASG